MAIGRKTGGRKKGSKNKLTLLKEKRGGDVLSYALSDITPLEVMLITMRDHWRNGNRQEAAKLAVDAAPYVHPKLQSVQHSGEVTISHEEAIDELMQAANLLTTTSGYDIIN